MRRRTYLDAVALTLGFLIATLPTPRAVAKAPSRSQGKVAAAHPGPLGLDWGKSPADARSQLLGKLTFVSEAPAEEGSYHTIDQHYSGTFGGIVASDVLLKFFKGEFFYLLVKVAPPEGPDASWTRVFESVVDKMRPPYGEPKGLRYPPKLASAYAFFDNMPMADRDKALPYLWNEQQRTDEAAFYRMRDQQILMGDFDPFAHWRFSNKVIVQTFLWHEAGSAPGVFTPVWIFCKEDVFKAWRASVARTSVIPPRDF